jgi:hypothetical protein
MRLTTARLMVIDRLEPRIIPEITVRGRMESNDTCARRNNTAAKYAGLALD